MKIKENVLSFNPCIPKDWKEVNIKYRYGKSIYNISIYNENGKNTGINKILLDGKEVENKINLDKSGKIFDIKIIM